MGDTLVVKVLEVMMYVLFGLSWINNIYKSLRYQSTKGKNLVFLILIDLGYLSAGLSKIIGYDAEKWQSSWWIFAFIVFNFFMVSLDIVLYFIFKHREKKAELEKQQNGN